MLIYQVALKKSKDASNAVFPTVTTMIHHRVHAYNKGPADLKKFLLFRTRKKSQFLTLGQSFHIH